MTTPHRTPEKIADVLLSSLGFYAEGSWSGQGTGDNEAKRARILAALREAADAARQEERQACAMAVCMYCGGRAPGWGPASGPNSAGNWTHGKERDEVLCTASTIHHTAWRDARSRAEEKP